MDRIALIASIRQKRNFLCVGLDPDFDRMPKHILEDQDPIFASNKAIIDATRDYCVAYKPNVAFYECHGAAGWESLQKTAKYIGEDHLVIADAKRGDIGNTSGKYAETFFASMDFDAVTVAPYMGRDSLQPFLDYAGRWTIVLAMTSNEGANDFQRLILKEGEELYKVVIRRAKDWGNEGNTMFVAGATRPELLAEIRALVPDHFLLVPGVGAQGGSLEEVCRYGLNDDVGLLVNVGRSILYADSGENFAEAAGMAAHEIAAQMESILEGYASNS